MSAKFSISRTSLSIASRFDNLNPSSISTDKIKALIYDFYGASTNVVISQFPDLLAIMVPDSQMSLIVEERKVQIIQHKISEAGSEPTEKFLKLVSETNSLISSPAELNAYGINFAAKVEFTGEKNVPFNTLTALNKIGVNNTTKIDKKLGCSIIGSSFHIIYNRDGLRHDLRIDPELGINLKGTDRVNASLNVHVVASEFPEYSALLENYTKGLKAFNEDLNAILTILI